MNKNKGIVDTEKKELLEEIDRAEEQYHQALEYEADELKTVQWSTNKKDLLVGDFEHQYGTPMDYRDLEKIIRLLPSGNNYVFIDFKDHPIEALRSRPFKAVYFTYPGLPRPVFISPYGKTVLPEWGTMMIEEKTIPDLRVRHFNRKDMPSKEWKGWDKGWVKKDPSEKSPWSRTINKTMGEDIDNPQSRGWRTVFIRIISMGFATRGEVEWALDRFFNRSLDGNRDSWKNI
jgi:hypothetical protein